MPAEQKMYFKNLRKKIYLEKNRILKTYVTRTVTLGFPKNNVSQFGPAVWSAKADIYIYILYVYGQRAL